MRPLASALCLMLLALAGCGEEQEPLPDPFAVAEPRGAVREVFRQAGIELEHAANWRSRTRDAPAVFEIFSGEAVVAGWAYARDEPLPETEGQLESARRRLVEAIEGRDPAFELERSFTTEVAGAPAVEVLGTQVISKRRLRTRSVHVFKGEVEYVFEAIAPPDSFSRTNAALRQVLASAELSGKLAGGRD